MKISYDKEGDRIYVDGCNSMIFSSGSAITLEDGVHSAMVNKEIPSLDIRNFSFVGRETNSKSKLALTIKLLRLIWGDCR